jgi:serine protease Do
MDSTSVPTPPRSRRLTSAILVFLTLAVGILIGTVIQRSVRGETNLAADAKALQASTSPQALSSAFSQVAKTIEPSVVNINTESTIKPSRRGRRAPSPDDEGDDNGDFQDFFDRFFGGQGQGPQARPEGMRQRSLGSGVIVDPKGYIVTNAHVVEKADRIRVNLAGDDPGKTYDAKVIGTDRETDLAVIKIEAGKSLPAAKLGNSDAMNVGDWVLAIGSPFGLEQTVTAGIISSKGRNIDNTHQFQSFLQTDAAINPGNSGGPLVNMNSEVVGINTAIFTQSMGSQGVGFAMPSSTVLNVYNQLIGPGNRVTRGSIGVVFNAVPNPAIQRVYGVNGGVTIASISPNGPAEAAGLKVGDTITAVDGKKIKSGDELVSDISARKPGTKAAISYVRNGKEDKATVTIADREKLFGTGDQEDEQASAEKPGDNKLGVAVKALTPQLAEQLDVPANKGVLVQDVKPNSFAEDVGLQRGNIILEINRKPVNSEEDFRRVQAELKSGQDVVFLVRDGRGGRGARNSGTIFLAGTLP